MRKDDLIARTLAEKAGEARFSSELSDRIKVSLGTPWYLRCLRWGGVSQRTEIKGPKKEVNSAPAAALARWRFRRITPAIEAIAVCLVLGILVGLTLMRTPGPSLMNSSEVAQSDPYDRDSFLRALRQAGLEIEKTGGTNAYVQFEVAQDAELGVWTDQGIMDVVFFPTKVEDSFSVTKIGDFSWRLSWSDKSVEWNSNRTWYFLAHNNVIIATDSQELSSILGGLRK